MTFHDTAAAPLPARVETPFGMYEVGPGDVITFPDGLPGFERCRQFVLLNSENNDLQYLRSIEPDGASFLAVHPKRVLPQYRCELSASHRRRLGLEDESTALWLALVAVGPDGAAWANLRAPVVINPATMIGFQVMPHNSLYPLRHAVDVASF